MRSKNYENTILYKTVSEGANWSRTIFDFQKKLVIYLNSCEKILANCVEITVFSEVVAD